MYIYRQENYSFLGSSGVGKSTLVNAIAGEEIMMVSEIRENDSKGRHTTTHRQLIELASGVIVIDTPGIRELGMWDVEDGINDTFSDVIELFTKCKYNNCSHSKEPGCAVNQAIEEGILSKDRWKTYCQLSNENEWGKNKSIYTKKGKLENKIKRGKK
ncbi:ribosome small subunit-dependent GTPase A [Tissierella sp. P1]|uniref:ribosome small subunit-dependent GTPase A n=1 Tax=Tissierella sp. P1 TaxID=1280483 RepID=UPI000BA0D780|nr:ribosome small subunit-dependent GTPase A [Tissierella sp. P1]OZV11990.1 ribosome small subunit-dependent GTPase A [Tissierella sp. P1]